MYGYSGFYPQFTVNYDDTPERKARVEAQQAARSVTGRVTRVCPGKRLAWLINEQLDWLSAMGWQGDVSMLRELTAETTHLMDLVEEALAARKAAAKAGEAA